MKVVVDREVCEAQSVCEKLCREVFRIDADDVLRIQVSEVPPEHVEKVREAVQRCPKQALSIVED